MYRYSQFLYAIFGAFCLLYCPALAAAMLAVVCGITGLESIAAHSAFVWLLAAPLLYFAWLILTLAISALEMQIWHLVGYRKPRRVNTDDGFRPHLVKFLTFGLYVRAWLLFSLPLTQGLQLFPILRLLVLLSYSPRVGIGRGVVLGGFLYDPDLTRIGDYAIVGGATRITPHSVTTTHRGGSIYTTSPIDIGPRAVIGGESRIGLGVQVGADAIVMAGSIVAPFTLIPAGEIWGGNPAVFLRKREDRCSETPGHHFNSPSTRHGAARLPEGADDLVAEVRVLVADALGLAVVDVPESLSTDDCEAWDSLAQMAILAAVSSRFGVETSSAMVSELRSISQIVQFLAKARSTPRRSTPGVVLPRNPELLPLFGPEQATRALAERHSGMPLTNGADELAVRVAATFTAEPLANSLKLWARPFGIQIDVEFAGYNQLHQSLLDPDSLFHHNRTGVNIVLTRPEDLLAGTSETMRDAVDTLLDAISRFAHEQPGTLVVATLPPPVSAFFNVEREIVEGFRANWRNRLGRIPGVKILDFAAIVEQVGVRESQQIEQEVVARSPYSASLYRELGIAVARLARQRRKAPAKVLALDADGVLWGGVVGEDGINGVHLGPDHPGRAFQLFQRNILELKRRGILLVLVSRNNADDVWRMIEGHPDMLLRRGDFAAARINWQPKSQNLRELADELNLGLEAFVFVDDDPAVRLEVESNAPAVTVIPMPADPAAYCRTIGKLWCFDTEVTTAEDRARTVMIADERKREEQRAAIGDLKAYLKALNLVVRMRAVTPPDLPRVAQLTQKTNQFNLSLKRRSLAEIQTLGPDYSIYALEASDRFGDYGLIGVCILKSIAIEPGLFELDTFLVSCRALGRGVEEAALYGAGQIILSRGGQGLLAPCVAGPRNQVVKELMLRKGFVENGTSLLKHDDVRELVLPEHLVWAGPFESPVRQAG